MPVDAEVKREAEVIRQVRESEPTDISTTHSSPTMQAVNNLAEALEGIPEDNTTSLDGANFQGGFTGKGLFGAFARRSSSANGGKDFWNAFGDQHRTPPPPIFYPRGSSSTTMSDDVNMDSPTVSTSSNAVFSSNWAVPTMEQPSAQIEQSRASPHQAQTVPTTTGPIQPLSAADGLRKVNKRRRDDDLDMQSIKRRAVSPGVSVGNSPILSQSPSQRSDNLWGQSNKAPPAREGSVTHGHGERAGSNGSISLAQTPLLGPKRVGLQGMNDMQGMTEKMSIE
jgi:hypothetical protein